MLVGGEIVLNGSLGDEVGDVLSGNGAKAHTHHGVSGGQNEVFESISARKIGQTGGRAGAQTAPDFAFQFIGGKLGIVA
jgi:hypothetical protein